MTMQFEQYADIFDNYNIADVGMLFFKTIGHLSENQARYYRTDAVSLIKDDLYANVDLSAAEEMTLNCINQIAYLDRLNDSVFERKSDDGFISYFAVEVEGTVRNCVADIKEITHILMRCTNRHNIILYRVQNSFLLCYGYRAIGKNSSITYSKWIVDDVDAEEIIEAAGIWNLPMSSLIRFAVEFRSSIRRSPEDLSYSTIAYQIFPSYYEQYDYDDEHLPSKEAREEFVEWYRQEYQIEDVDDFNDESLYIIKDNLLEDDFEITEDELEMRMIEAEMNGELYGDTDEHYNDDYELIDDDEYDAAVKLLDKMGDIDDPEALLKAMDEQEETIKTTNHITPVIQNIIDNAINQAKKEVFSCQNTNEEFVGTIYVLISHFNLDFPFAIRRTKWKTKTLFFIVEELKGNYAYGYMIKDGVRDNNTSYPADNQDIIWQLCENILAFDEQADDEPNIELKMVNEAIYEDEEYIISFHHAEIDNGIDLYFNLENYSERDVSICLKKLRMNLKPVSENQYVDTVKATTENAFLVHIDNVDLSSDVSFQINFEFDDDEYIIESDIEIYIDFETGFVDLEIYDD